MPKYYVQSGGLRMVLVASDAEQAAVKLFQRSSDRQAEIYSHASADLIRDVEAMDYMLDDDIEVNEVGFGATGQVFDTLDIAARWQRVGFR